MASAALGVTGGRLQLVSCFCNVNFIVQGKRRSGKIGVESAYDLLSMPDAFYGRGILHSS